MKDWQDARAMIQNIKVVDTINNCLYRGTCTFNNYPIYFSYNFRRRLVTSTSYLKGNAELLGFSDEPNIPYLINQAIVWAFDQNLTNKGIQAH